MSASDARSVAVKVVTRVRAREAYAHETMDSVLKTAELSERDTAFATRLAYGTIACRGTLDDAIGELTDNRHALEPEVADALAVSAYELLFARTPARAAVSQGVELVKAVRPKASRLANAVLRRLAEKAETFPWGDPETDVSALARLHGHPGWMAELLLRDLGKERAASMMAADNEPAPLYLAHLPQAGAYETAIDSLARAGSEPSDCATVPGCIVAGVPAAARRSKAITSRQVIVADAGAQLAAACARPVGGAKIVEIGAGRGTKTLILSGIARLNGEPASILAVDTHAFKLAALAEAAAALGLGEIETLVADASDPAGPLREHVGSADVVLIDAPCSGLGTLRRHPDRRWRATPSQMESLAALGASLLGVCSSLVRPGGFVLYSTCTVAKRENDEVVRGFLASEQGKEFALDSLEADVPAAWRGFVAEEGWFTSIPAVGGPDGHFIARLRRA